MISLANFASRASEVVAGIIEQIKDRVAGIIDAIFGDGEGEEISDAEKQAQAETEFDAWGEEYADMVGQTEVCAAVEEEVVHQMQQAGVEEIYWLAEPDACDRCLANADASPLPIDQLWPSGDTAPPAHPRCRCTIAPA
ncbi:hypothetical protein KTT_41030 [Tengunoibacter tsumagoiensis]|uniref:Phage head morphogenesis domain-containing protein n=1 Tax=Tengunoibacter tsumagoiensis TaxID=2014871 RepID=A0A402A518_9CHLR|nr:hypothetical protein KTT_40490 [Tengunoibacter tsumagoiensis]GCE14244.1 hypothetical protein KTT_41030 [Tengunoibacter tsumagoiensis]